MKSFHSISDALALHKTCPICHGHLQISDDKDSTYFFDYRSDDFLCYELMDEDLVAINKNSGEIYFIINSNNNFNYHNAFCVIKAECMKFSTSCLFSYELLCYFDAENMKLSNIFLLSERLSIDNSNNKFCLITNNYEQNITEYSVDVFSSNMSIKKLPLVNLNFKQPKETLEKIEKFSIFT